MRQVAVIEHCGQGFGVSEGVVDAWFHAVAGVRIHGRISTVAEIRSAWGIVKTTARNPWFWFSSGVGGLALVILQLPAPALRCKVICRPFLRRITRSPWTSASASVKARQQTLPVGLVISSSIRTPPLRVSKLARRTTFPAAPA